jgi:peptidoglycan/xylan/chitin deacetylase (PgdA/CDA1 family)
VYTRDWQIPEISGERIGQDILQQLLNGSMILLHDGYPLQESWDKSETVLAVKTVVAAAKERGYKFVTVSELLGVEPYGSPPR